MLNLINQYIRIVNEYLLNHFVQETKKKRMGKFFRGKWEKKLTR